MASKKSKTTSKKRWFGRTPKKNAKSVVKNLKTYRIRITVFALVFCLLGAYLLNFGSAAASAEVASGIAGACLNDPGNSTKSGTVATVANCNGSNGQHWVISGAAQSRPGSDSRYVS